MSKKRAEPRMPEAADGKRGELLAALAGIQQARRERARLAEERYRLIGRIDAMDAEGGGELGRAEDAAIVALAAIPPEYAELPQEPAARLEAVRAELDAIGDPAALRRGLGEARGRLIEEMRMHAEQVTREVGELETAIARARDAEGPVVARREMLEGELAAL